LSFERICSPAVTQLARLLKQTKPFDSPEEEVLLALQVAVARITEPWAVFLKTAAALTPSQYNVLRILRGAHPTRVTCGEIVERMIARDPDVTRLVDRLARRGLVDRQRSRSDRRVVGIGITAKGLDLLATLDPSVTRMPKAVLGHLNKTKLRELAGLLDGVLEKPARFP
jgi:DNA-binding MarR family transcriptional regulator